MKVIGFVGICSMMLVGCIIEVLPAHQLDDGFGRLTETCKEQLRPFSSHRKVIDDKLVQEISCAQLSEYLSEHGCTWLMLVASWCPYAMKDAMELASHRGFVDSMRITPIVVFIDYDLPSIRKVQRQWGEKVPVVVLGGVDHASGGWLKWKYLLDHYLPEISMSERVPQHYLLDEQSHVLRQHDGAITKWSAFLDDGDPG